MQRMRCRWRDLRIGTCSRQSSWCQLGAVISVNQIMGHARMVRMSLINGFENCSRELLVRMSPVLGRGNGNEGQGIKHLCLGVPGTAVSRLFHHLFIGL